MIVAGFVVVVAAGGVALLLAARKQWLSERTQAHSESVAAINKTDAEERRIIDAYTKAVEQLGSEKTAVRLGGLYALERLAREYAAYRQYLGDIICAYLSSPLESEPSDSESRVRLAAQRLLARNVKSEFGEPPSGWRNVRFDLRDATFHSFELGKCDVWMDLRGARFECPVTFASMRHVDLSNALIAERYVSSARLPRGWFLRTSYVGDDYQIDGASVG